MLMVVVVDGPGLQATKPFALLERNKTNQEPVVFRIVRQANSHKLNLNCSFVLLSEPEIKSQKLEGDTSNWIKTETRSRKRLFFYLLPILHSIGA